MSAIPIYKLQIECKLQIDRILAFDISVSKDCHARMHATVLIGACMRQQIIEVFCGSKIAAWKIDENGAKVRCLFAGQIDNLHMDYEGDFEKITISAVSSTILLDIEKKSRSFQDTSRQYFDIISTVLNDTKEAGAFLCVQDMFLKKPVIQYEETDWEFIKRLASHLKTSVVPGFSAALPKVYIGLNNGTNIGPMEYIKYKTGFDSRYYTDGKLLNLSRTDFVYYDVDSYALCNIGDRVTFLGYQLQICALKYTLRHDMIYCVYRLATPAYFSVQQAYNDNLRGLSLQGTVLETDHELVRIHLDIDDQQNPKTAYDYTWRPETGNLMYCMPEPGTRVALYMQSPDEFSAVCKNCDRTNGAQFPEAQHPEDRYLTTAHDKLMFWKPDEAGFTSLKVNSFLKIDDAAGAIIESSGVLLMQADKDITVGGKRVDLNAPKEVSLIRRALETPTVLNACYNLDIIGNIGEFATNKPPSKPKNQTSALGEIEEFDISEIADMLISAIPSGFKSESTQLSTAIQGTLVAHISNERERD